MHNMLYYSFVKLICHISHLAVCCFDTICHMGDQISFFWDNSGAIREMVAPLGELA